MKEADMKSDDVNRRLLTMTFVLNLSVSVIIFGSGPSIGKQKAISLAEDAFSGHSVV
jgi:hypothetical protein